MKIYAIAVWDGEETTLMHEVVKAEDEYNACVGFKSFWDLVTSLSSDSWVNVPKDLDSLSEFTDNYSLTVSIIEVQ